MSSFEFPWLLLLANKASIWYKIESKVTECIWSHSNAYWPKFIWNFLYLLLIFEGIKAGPNELQTDSNWFSVFFRGSNNTTFGLWKVMVSWNKYHKKDCKSDKIYKQILSFFQNQMSQKTILSVNSMNMTSEIGTFQSDLESCF